MKLNIFSDLRKPGLVPGESLSLSKKYEFCFRETLIYKMSNRMRNLHKQLRSVFEKLSAAGLRLKPSKCEFFKS